MDDQFANYFILRPADFRKDVVYAYRIQRWDIYIAQDLLDSWYVEC